MANRNIMVYGTLKSDQRSHYLLERCNFLGFGKITGMTMMDFTVFPVAMFSSNPSAQIWGEVYEIPEDGYEEIKAAIDRYEGSNYQAHIKLCHLDKGYTKVYARVMVYAGNHPNNPVSYAKHEIWPQYSDIPAVN